jgi:murein DD-endopeptidase MepM/ murein hydrolase activator NlpD
MQGDVLVVRAQAGADETPIGFLGDIPVHFAPDGAAGSGKFIALVGINAMMPPGQYTLGVNAPAAAADDVEYCLNVTTREIPITVQAGGYIQEKVPLPAALEYTLAPSTVNAEQNTFNALYAGFTPKKRWSGAFDMPAKGEFMAGFGGRRTYNDLPQISYHSGIDISAEEGTPVRAAAAGRVVMAQSFVIRGNALVIDHGRGVFTAYFHLSKFEVKVGDDVDAGQLVARVGGTGRSQGRHLHFELAVGGSPVEPLDWLKAALP